MGGTNVLVTLQLVEQDEGNVRHVWQDQCLSISQLAGQVMYDIGLIE